MKIGTKIVIFLIILFSINIVFYYISEDYRFFLKKIKNSDEIVYLEEKQITDDLPKIELISEGDTNIQIKEQVENEIGGTEGVKKDIIISEQEVVLGKNYKEIIDTFDSYNFQKIDMNTNLFDLTDEYPDAYYEYYSPKLTVYLFTTRGYSEIYNIFDLLQDNLPFTINEVNNFGTHSFYINLKEDIDDNSIRLVIENKGIVFGLKIKKDEYNNVKSKLLFTE